MINIVLFQPEIPQNTGNIMRTCVGINAKLHLVKPFGFSLEESAVKRSAANYLQDLNYVVYDSVEDFFSMNTGTYYFLTRYATQSYSDIKYNSNEEIYLIFGSESKGIAKELLAANYDKCYRIPTTEKIRSLNLSNAVAIVAYEVMRQLDFPDLLLFDKQKGEDYLKT